MRLFIPDVGVSMRLLQNWTFDLKREGRNNDVWEALNCDLHPSLEQSRARIARMEAARQEIADRMVPSPLRRRHGIYVDYASTEDRNADFALRDEIYSAKTNQSVPVTLEAGTVLKVDRVYIRQGAEDFSSLSFYIEETPMLALVPAKKGGGFKKGRRRFFASLVDVNTMDIEQVV